MSRRTRCYAWAGRHNPGSRGAFTRAGIIVAYGPEADWGYGVGGTRKMAGVLAHELGHILDFRAAGVHSRRLAQVTARCQLGYIDDNGVWIGLALASHTQSGLGIYETTANSFPEACADAFASWSLRRLEDEAGAVWQGYLNQSMGELATDLAFRLLEDQAFAGNAW